MDRLFRKLPLSVKLSIIGIVPLLFFIYLSARYYIEKDKCARRFESYIGQIQQTVTISNLIDELQQERRMGFEKALSKDVMPVLNPQYQRTDSLISVLGSSQVFANFTKYTFLDSLQSIRSKIETGLPPAIIMHYYSTVIFRLGTISNISPFGSVYLRKAYPSLVGQRLLSEMANYLGILRANIYNVLYTGQHAQGTLYGLIGVYDIYKSYEKEFDLKISTGTRQQYAALLKTPAYGATTSYLEKLFARMSFDSSYNATQWWSVSEQAKNELRTLEKSLLQSALDDLNSLSKAENAVKQRSLVILLISIMIVIMLVFYTIYILTGMFNEMRRAAKKLARGTTGSRLDIYSKDAMGSLAKSINLIENNYKKLADAAAAIGKGRFDVTVDPRGPDDELGKALVDMKNDLEELTLQQRLRQQLIATAVVTAQEKERTRLGGELHDNVNQMLASVKLYLQMMENKNELQGDLMPKAIENLSYAIGEIRNISHRLILPSLRGDSLLDSLQQLMDELKLASPINIYMDVKEFDENNLNEAQRIAIYRIVQEQLNNILKYSSATTAAIFLKNTEGKFFLFIEDNGKGFDLSEKRNGVGISNIINRAELLNGSVQIDTSPGNGCRLKVLLETTEN